MDEIPKPPAIDLLLFRYLDLIDSYMTLTSLLTRVHTAMHVNLAKANFVAPHGERFGPERFPTTMEARWRVDVTVADYEPPARAEVAEEPAKAAGDKDAEDESCSLSGEDSELGGPSILELVRIIKLGGGIPTFRVINRHSEDADLPTDRLSLNPHRGDSAGAGGERNVDHAENEDESDDSYEKVDPFPAAQADPGDTTTAKAIPPRKKPSPHDPLFWISALPTQTLRTAQSQAVVFVTEVVPGLATVAAEMRAVEIKIRRLRKHRAKGLKDKSSQEAQSKDVKAPDVKPTSS
ncbi:hypothetical protein MKZ38_003804 [Zalerion maritima]|uniref:Vacuolar ATPase assembly protein VMA22 n=1 Tax=Zalerion maritima TaxID=339359 RepID=A0AAD5RNN7_9PEZI|nr:hypothetical protein MKZ38_003804 [Zalerion maritima]